MRLVRHFTLILSTLLVMLFGATVAVASPAPAAQPASSAVSHDGVTCPTSQRDSSPSSAPTNVEPYYLGDWRLGPKVLPERGPIGTLLDGYERLDDFPAAAQFLACYWNDTIGGWWYPDQDGFVLHNGQPVKRKVTLRTGQKLDLFGSGMGRFLAPAGTPYEKRGLPPSNLDTYDPDYPFSYHLYEVAKPFAVDAGPIRPWFGQPGLGLQYVVNADYRPGAAGIPSLVMRGYLRPLN